MRIYVRTGGRTMSFQVSGLYTVEDLKETILKKEGIPIAGMRLSFAGKELLDYQTLRHYNIQEQSCLKLVLPSRTPSYSQNSISMFGSTSLGTHELWDSSLSLPSNTLKEDEFCGDMVQALICPISQEIFKDPVVAEDGHTYERKDIEQWLDMGHRTSPMTNLYISRRLVPNYAMRAIIACWRKSASS